MFCKICSIDCLWLDFRSNLNHTKKRIHTTFITLNVHTHRFVYCSWPDLIRHRDNMYDLKTRFDKTLTIAQQQSKTPSPMHVMKAILACFGMEGLHGLMNAGAATRRFRAAGWLPYIISVSVCFFRFWSCTHHRLSWNLLNIYWGQTSWIFSTYTLSSLSGPYHIPWLFQQG